MSVFVIAEIGNCHFGDINVAKEMIRVAKECGASAVKFQAAEAKDLIRYGSMPEDFYKKVCLSFDEHEELIEDGIRLGIPVFHSIFSPSMVTLWEKSKYRKVSAKQSVTCEFNDSIDTEDTFASVNPNMGDLPKIENAKIMYACNYLTSNPDLWYIDKLKSHYKRPVGYSDHTIGIEACYEAYCKYDVPFIEKHFTFDKKFRFNGTLFRDCIHSSDPGEFESLCNLLNGGSLH